MDLNTTELNLRVEKDKVFSQNQPTFPYKVIYMSEEETKDILMKICNNIESAEYNHINFYPFAMMKSDRGYILVAEKIRKLLLETKPYTDDIEKTIIRLFGTRQYYEEAKIYMNWSRLFYDIENNNININSSQSLFIHYMKRYLDEIGQKTKYTNMMKLLEYDANINIQDNDGNTYLHHFMQYFAWKRVYPEGQSTYLEFLKFMLENGADPSLPNKKGDTCWSINEKMKKGEKKIEIYRDNDTVNLCDLFSPILERYI
jgi:uncharacterized protein (UPF0297 family)